VRIALAECELPTTMVWMRGGYAPLSETVKRILRRSDRVPRPADSAAKASLFGAGRTRWLWAWWVVLEQIAVAIVQVRLPRLLGVTAVAERFVPDTLCDLSERYNDPDFAMRLPARVLGALTPRANLVLLLDLPGNVAFARKPDDWSPEVLERRRALYRKIVAERVAVCTLDAERPRDELEAEVVQRVLDTVFSRIAARNPLSKLPRDAWE
jgi:thymidylate kinase